MVDFRYHLISITAVLLALGLGILTGSGFLGGPILRRLESQVGGLADKNRRLRAEITELSEKIEADAEFTAAVEPWLIDKALKGDDVAIVQFEGTNGTMVDEITDEILRAGGTPGPTITLTAKLALEGEIERDQLALILGSSTSAVRELQATAGEELGARMAGAAAASPGTTDDAAAPETTDLDELLSELERNDFAAIDNQREGGGLAPGSAFIIAGGGSDSPPFDVSVMLRSLATNLATDQNAVVVVSPTEDDWEFVAALRRDAEARQAVASVDGGESVVGRIATVLALRRAMDGQVGHYGSAPGATQLIPAPTPTA